MMRRPRRKFGYRRKRVVPRASLSGGKVVALKNSLAPDRLITKFVYKDNINLSSTSPTWFTSKMFRLNSIYDPDLDITNGHQPLGYDQWINFYGRYRVFKAVVRVELMNNQAGPIQCGFIPYNFEGSVPSAGDDAFYEQPHAVTKTIAGNQGINKTVLTKVVDLPRIIGKSHEQYRTGTNVSSLFGANPVEQVYGIIGVRSINDSSSTNVVAICTITYYTELFDRKPQSISYPDGKDPNWDFNPSYSPSFQQDSGAGPIQH